MHARTTSTEITKKSFWSQRLQAVESNVSTPMFFDKAIAPPAPGADSIRSGKGDVYGRTAVPVTVNPRDLQVAAVMHHVSPESIVMVAWALLLRSYAGEDGPVNFGACLDREQAAWLFTMPVSSDEQLLSAMRSAEQEKRLMLDYGLTFRSLGSFVQETGYHDIATAVYVHSGNIISPHMYFPVRHTPLTDINPWSTSLSLEWSRSMPTPLTLLPTHPPYRFPSLCFLFCLPRHRY